MKKLMSGLVRRVRGARARAVLLVGSAVLALSALVPTVAAAEEVAGEDTSGKKIAESFVTPLTTKFTEALPIIIGFLVLVAATVAIIKFVQSRGRAKHV
jgi:hypothetical protein